MPFTMKNINRIHRYQTVFRGEKLRIDLCGAHHLFVYAICGKPGRSQDELAETLFLNKSTVTRALTSLEQNGYVRREANPDDKRQTLVFPTEKMLNVLPEVKRISKEWNDTISSGISPEELEVFNSVLERIEKNAIEAIKTLGGLDK